MIYDKRVLHRRNLCPGAAGQPISKLTRYANQADELPALDSPNRTLLCQNP